jgi:lipoprotein-anchoring transpeptidase ErfK/SrfK
MWPARHEVVLDAHLAGVRAGPGMYGTADRTVSFEVGRAMVSTVDTRTHQMVVKQDGEVAQRMAVSAGMGTTEEYTTTSGVHLTMEKNHHVVMDSASVGCPPGCPDHYRHDVYYAVRISDSGEYEHSAPWSVGDQGHRNVSHGCINLGPRDARWFYRHTRPGDVVEVTGTRRPLRPGNGWGYWQLSWPEWLSGSLLGTSYGQGMPAPGGTAAQAVARH